MTFFHKVSRRGLFQEYNKFIYSKVTVISMMFCWKAYGLGRTAYTKKPMRPYKLLMSTIKLHCTLRMWAIHFLLLRIYLGFIFAAKDMISIYVVIPQDLRIKVILFSVSSSEIIIY